MYAFPISSILYACRTHSGLLDFTTLTTLCRSVIAQSGYGLDDRGSRVRFPAGLGIFVFAIVSRMALGAHPASYPMGVVDSFAGGKVAGVWSWPLHLLPKSRMRGAIPPPPQYVFMAWCLVKHRDNFTFTLTTLCGLYTSVYQKFPDWVDNEINNNNKHSLRSNTKG
jgi:hypothetical protein